MSRAGSRVPRYQQTTGMGRLSDQKRAVLVTAITRQLAIVSLDPKEWDEENNAKIESEQGDNIVLMITVPGSRRPLKWNLSAMTLEELEATRQFFEHLFDLADPIIRERDKVADEAFSRGDDSYNRVYRSLPQFITRPRKESPNSESVHDGPEDAPQGPGD